MDEREEARTQRIAALSLDIMAAGELDNVRAIERAEQIDDEIIEALAYRESTDRLMARINRAASYLGSTLHFDDYRL